MNINTVMTLANIKYKVDMIYNVDDTEKKIYLIRIDITLILIYNVQCTMHIVYCTNVPLPS